MEHKKNNNELLSKSECLEIINTAFSEVSKVKIELDDFEYEIVPASKDVVGFLGEYYSLRLDIKKKKGLRAKLLQYFIKTLPITNDINRKMISGLEIFPKEVDLYTNLFKDMEKYSPPDWHCKCYFTRPDLLVFENLNLFGYRNMREDETFTELYIQATLKCMAQMHCSSIVLEEKSGCRIGKKYESSLKEVTLDDSTHWFSAGLRAIQAVASNMAKYKSSNITDFLPNPDSYEELIRIANESDKFRNTFCHRDIWNRNILFKYDENDFNPKEAVLVDFQTCRYCPPAIDVMMFLILNQSSADRKLNFDWCAKYYYDNLKMYLNNCRIYIETIFTFKEFLLSCNYVKLLPLVLKGIYVPFSNTPDKQFFANLKESNPIKYDHIMKEDRTEVVLSFVKESTDFRELMYEVIDDIIDCSIEIKNNGCT